MVKSTADSHQIKLDGARFQERVANKIIEQFKIRRFKFLTREDISTAMMSLHDADLVFSEKLQELFPVTFSCKSSKTKHKTLYNDYSEALKDANKMGTTRDVAPVLAIQANDTDVLVVLSADDFIDMASKLAVVKYELDKWIDAYYEQHPEDDPDVQMVRPTVEQVGVA